MKHLKRVASKLDDHGRGGDTLVAHINPREAALLKALGGSGTINPKTGLLEFSDQGVGEAGSGGGTETGFGGGFDGYSGYDGGGLPGEPALDGTPTNPQTANPGTLNSDFAHDNGSYGMPTGIPSQDRIQFQDVINTRTGFPDYLGERISDKISNMRDNPFATIANTAFNVVTGGFPAAANTVSGWVGGPTFGSMATAAGRGIGSAFGAPQDIGTQVAGEVEGKTTGAIDPSGDPDRSGEGGDGYNPTQSGPTGSGMSPLATALLGEAPVTNPWGNMGRRKTLGALESSFSPYGQQYVTPWAYRG
jgi:hypothetical protein